ncbi:hypothetical protein [Halegenticoccus tardaugens]|uniref:hypothetical protein n=1 Tax=Halegenticoccus tardaugens TaxID=2071624 RepID=UPI00100B21CD|nr:hypothetical protein [Halegenticoccus tardaugens]
MAVVTVSVTAGPVPHFVLGSLVDLLFGFFGVFPFLLEYSLFDPVDVPIVSYLVRFVTRAGFGVIVMGVFAVG